MYAIRSYYDTVRKAGEHEVIAPPRREEVELDEGAVDPQSALIGELEARRPAVARQAEEGRRRLV